MYEKKKCRINKSCFDIKVAKKTLSVSFFLLFFLSFLTLKVNAQTPGLIYKPATTAGKAVMDPNGDGYTSATTSGFQGGIDYGSQSELKMIALPQYTVEPVGDLSTGASGGQTDIVGGANSVYVLNDGTNLIIRFRIGKNSTASKGYTLLIDLNGKFGTADPNYTTTNMGFEREVTLETNFGVVVRDLVNNTTVNTYAYGTHDQRSISATTISGNTNVFYDFYVPLSDITATPNTTTMRFAATTVTSAQSGTTGPISDINGINDQTYSGNTFAALATAVNSFPPTTLGSMTTGFTFPASLTSTPVITSSIAANSTTISGTSLETNGTTITLYRKVGAGSYTSVGTTTVTSGAWSWTISGLSPVLTAGDLFYATATASGYSESSASNIVTVSAAAVCYTPAPVITAGANGSQTISGTWSDGVTTTGTSVRIRFWQQTANANTFTEVGPSGSTGASPTTPTLVTFTGTSGTFTNSGIQPSQTLFKQGAIYVTATLGSCTSGYSNADLPVISGSSGTVTPAPTITTSSITASTGSTSVTVQSNYTASTLILYVNGIQQAVSGSTVNSGATTTLSYTGFNTGDIVTARAIGSTSSYYLSDPSNSITVTAATATQSTAPIISGHYYSSSTTVSGTSVEQSGSTITLYKAGSTVLGTTTVNGYGNWTVSSLTLTTGDVLTAKVTALGKTISNASTSVTVLAAATAPSAPVVTSPIQASATSVSGTAGSGTVTIYIDGSAIGTVTSASGAWTLSGLQTTDIYKGAVIYATNTNTTSFLSSVNSNSVTATGVDHFLVEASGGGNITTQTAGVAFPIQITAETSTNTTFTNYTSTNVVSSGSTVTSGGGPTGAFTSGALTGWSMTLTTAGTYSLTTLSTDDPTTTGTSNTFVINATVQNKLVIHTQPSTTASSQVYFSQQPVIYIQDQYGNTVTTDNSTQVTVSLASGTGTLNGQLTVTAVNGVATFTGLSITGTGSFTLSFAKTGLTGVTSGTITVSANSPAAPTALSYSSPQTYLVNTAITPLSPTVTGTVTTFSISPGLPTGLSINTGTGVISGTPTVSAVSAVYTVTASNGTGSTTYGVNITVTALAVTISSQTNVIAFGASTGAVTVGGSGGTSPYQYKIGSGSLQSSGTFSSLAAGTYTVTVQDANSNT